jgi:hypothetical protein
MTKNMFNGAKDALKSKDPVMMNDVQNQITQTKNSIVNKFESTMLTKYKMD